MPRKTRIGAPGTQHNTLIRGIKRIGVFENNKDRPSLRSEDADLIAASAAIPKPLSL